VNRVVLLGRTPWRFIAELRRRPDPLFETWSGVDGGLAIAGMIVYMAKVGHVPEVETTMALQQIMKLSPAEEIIFAEKVLAERAAERGRREGKLEGQQEFLRKLLTQRFGELPPEADARVQAATPTELEKMGLRILSAATLDEVLGKPKRRRK